MLPVPSTRHIAVFLWGFAFGVKDARQFQSLPCHVEALGGVRFIESRAANVTSLHLKQTSSPGRRFDLWRMLYSMHIHRREAERVGVSSWPAEGPFMCLSMSTGEKECQMLTCSSSSRSGSSSYFSVRATNVSTAATKITTIPIIIIIIIIIIVKRWRFLCSVSGCRSCWPEFVACIYWQNAWPVAPQDTSYLGSWA